MDTISAESLVHCAVVRFMPQPPAVAPTGGAGFFVARVYDPSSCNVHNLNSGNFRPEAFAAEISFIFEGPGKNRAASAGAAHSDAVAGTPKAAPKPAAPPQPAPKAAAAPEVIQKQRGAPPPEAHTVAATLRESLRRESTQAGRVRLLNQVATQSPHVRAVLASGDAAASIAAWMQLAIKQTPLGGGGGEAANALLAAALKALDALPLDRSTFAAQKGDSLMEAARTTASTPTVAPAQQQAAGALVLRWRGLVAAGDDAPSQEQSQSAAARAAAFGASPRSTEAAATLVGVARRASGAKTPVAASNGGGAATKTASVKRAAAPADSAGAPADDGDDAMVLPPPPKRAKGASPTAAAAGEARAEAAAVRAATAAIAAGGGVGVNSAHKRAAAEKVEDALTAVALALKLSRAARQALIHCDDPAAEMGTLVEVRRRRLAFMRCRYGSELTSRLCTALSGD